MDRVRVSGKETRKKYYRNDPVKYDLNYTTTFPLGFKRFKGTVLGLEERNSFNPLLPSIKNRFVTSALLNDQRIKKTFTDLIMGILLHLVTYSKNRKKNVPAPLLEPVVH